MYGTGALAGTVKDDVQAAYISAAGQTSTVTMSDIDSGGKTLLPGMYKFAVVVAAALSDGQLFLDANGDANAV
jgi:hypothetical protein